MKRIYWTTKAAGILLVGCLALSIRVLADIWEMEK